MPPIRVVQHASNATALLTSPASEVQVEASSAVRPGISVIIPAYNAAKTIEATLRSVSAQTMAPLEIVVVDDGSTDSTAELVSALHPMVKLIRQPNRGVSEARNAGVKAAIGDWLAFLDADDLWLPNKLERQMPETRDPRVGVIACRSATKQGRPLGRQISFEDLWSQNDIMTSSSLVRRSAFDHAGGFWAGRICEDYHLWLRLAALGWTIVNVPEDLIIYAPAPNSLSGQIASLAISEMDCLQDIAARFCMPHEMLRKRLLACCLNYSRAAVHQRDLAMARRLALRAMGYGLSFDQLLLLIAAMMPRFMLDVRRHALGRWQRDTQRRAETVAARHTRLPEASHDHR